VRTTLKRPMDVRLLVGNQRKSNGIQYFKPVIWH
jgi:hypothetical protein